MSKVKLFGCVTHRTSRADGTPRTYWDIEADPDVAIRLKRIFPRAHDNIQGFITLADTPEMCRELEWILERWPMHMSAKQRESLAERAQEHRDQEQQALKILSGKHLPKRGMRTPAITPRDYQLIASDLLLTTGRLLLVDELGLGKTITSLLALRRKDAGPALVVCPTNLPPQWTREVQRTFPELRVHTLTSTKPYKISEAKGMDGHDPDIIITSYSKLSGWAHHLAGQVNTVIFDEIQELRRPDTQKYNAACMIAHQATYRMGLTATPVYNYGDEIHAIVSVLDPDALGDRREFAREWGHIDHRGRIRISDPDALGVYLRNQGLMLRRTRQEVGRELPEVQRVLHVVEIDHKTMHQATRSALDLAKLIVARDGTRQQRFKASGELDARMRYATGMAKAHYVAAFVKLLMESQKKILLVGWHHDVYDVWRKELAEFKPVFYTGQQPTPAQKEAAQMAFMEGDSRILVMSLRSGAGLDGLQKVCNVVVFGEMDWSPGMHKQVIGRLHRDDMIDDVVAYFLAAEEGSDPVMIEVHGLKEQQADGIVDPYGDPIQEINPTIDRIPALARQLLEQQHVAA